MHETAIDTHATIALAALFHGNHDVADYMVSLAVMRKAVGDVEPGKTA